MNKIRRKALYDVANKLTSLKHTNNDYNETDLELIKGDLDVLLYEEESYMDNIPENFQSGYRYQMAEEACDNIECAIDAINDGDIDNAISYIYAATV